MHSSHKFAPEGSCKIRLGNMDVFSYVNFEIGGLIGSFVSPSEKIEINGADLSAQYICINEDSKTLDTVKLRVLTRLV